MLEERRVFHAGAVAPMPGSAAPPRPRSRHRRLRRRFPSMPTRTCTSTTLPGRTTSSRSGLMPSTKATRFPTRRTAPTPTSRGHRQRHPWLFVPYAVIAGEKLIFDTAGGDDSLTVDLSSAAGTNHRVRWRPGRSRRFASDGRNFSQATTCWPRIDRDSALRLRVGKATVELIGVEPVPTTWPSPTGSSRRHAGAALTLSDGETGLNCSRVPSARALRLPPRTRAFRWMPRSAAAASASPANST